MTLETQSPDTSPTFDSHVDDVLSMQKAREAASRLDAATQYEPVAPSPDAEPQQTGTGNPNSLRNKVLVTAAVAATAGTALGFAVGGASERQHQDTEQVVASSSFTPSSEYGDLIGPADAEVDQLLESQGLDPNTISYSDVQNELSNASEELQEATGRTEPLAGEPYDVDLITSTGLFGDNRVSIDITPKAADAPDATPIPPAETNE